MQALSAILSVALLVTLWFAIHYGFRAKKAEEGSEGLERYIDRQQEYWVRQHDQRREMYTRGLEEKDRELEIQRRDHAEDRKQYVRTINDLNDRLVKSGSSYVTLAEKAKALEHRAVTAEVELGASGETIRLQSDRIAQLMLLTEKPKRKAVKKTGVTRGKGVFKRVVR